MTTLVQLELSQNELTGTIPIDLINLKNLDLLHLNQNHLTGVIPPLPATMSSCLLGEQFSVFLFVGMRHIWCICQHLHVASFSLPVLIGYDFGSQDTVGEENCFSDTSNVDAFCDTDFICGKCLSPNGVGIVDCDSLIEDRTVP